MMIQSLGANSNEIQLSQLCSRDTGLIELLENCATIVKSQSGGKLLGLVISKGVKGAVVATDLCLICQQLLQTGRSCAYLILRSSGSICHS